MAAHRWRHLTVGIVGVAAAVVVGLLLSNRTTLCADLERLVRESASDFAAIRGELLNRTTGEWSTSLAIDGASDCSIFIDIERAGHTCSWEYSATNGAGPAEYDKAVDDVRSCLGSDLVETEDPGVNHPDFWAARNFAISDGEVSVSLKNKNALGKVFVSIGVDRFVNP